MARIMGDISRDVLINTYIQARGYQSYLELGTCLGETFDKIQCVHKVSVDNGDYPFKPTYNMTTNHFFAQNKEKFDLIFIDANHEESFVWRDIHNSLKALTKGGVIICHDCNPPTLRYEQKDLCWTAWRAFVRYRAASSYRTFCYDSDFGLGIIDTSQKKSTEQSILKLLPILSYEWLQHNRNVVLGLTKEVIL